MNADIELLHSMVATPSVSRDETAAAELLVAHMNANGFDAHVDEAGNAIGLRSGPEADGERRTVVLLGHIDTVPGEIPVRIEEGILHGRGAVDAKGSICAFTRAVASVEPAAGVDLVIAGCVEEEVETSAGARHLRERFRPEACLIGEPSSWDALTLGYKGILRLKADFEAPGGHSAGPLPHVAEAAAELWQRLKAWCEEFNAGRERLFDQLLPSLQEFVTSTDGLHDRVKLRVGFRLPPDFDPATLEAFCREQAAGAELEFLGHEVAWSSKATTPLARALRRSILQQGGRGAAKHKTGTSDMNVVGPVWGCPIVAYGPGDSTLDHTPEERLPLEDYEKSIAVLRGALIAGGWAS